MQTIRPHSRSSIDDGSQISGEECFLREFKEFESQVVSPNRDDRNRFQSPHLINPVSGYGKLYIEQNSTINKVSNPTATGNEVGDQDSADQLDEFTDLEDDSLEPTLAGHVNSSVVNESSASTHRAYNSPMSRVDHVQKLSPISIMCRNIDESFNNSMSYQDSDLEVINPQHVISSANEDPIATHDAVVAQMTLKGVEWVPADQKTKKTAHVRWFAPEVEECDQPVLKNNLLQKSEEKEVTISPTNTINQIPKIPNHATSTRMPTVHLSTPRPNNTLNVIPQTNNVNADSNAVQPKLMELESQLSQEKATRKQQEDYIKQLQKYYDNLLAKHALAEVTIDQLRLGAKVNPDQPASGTISRSGSRMGLPHLIEGYNSVNSQLNRKTLSDSFENNHKYPRSPSNCYPVSTLPSTHTGDEPLPPAIPMRHASLNWHVGRQSVSMKTVPQKINPTFIDRRGPFSASVGQLADKQINNLPSEHRMESYSVTSSGRKMIEDSSCKNSYPKVPNQTNVESNCSIAPSSTDSMQAQLQIDIGNIFERLRVIEDFCLPGQMSTEDRRLVINLGNEIEETQRKYHAAMFLCSNGNLSGNFDSYGSLSSQLSDIKSRFELFVEKSDRQVANADTESLHFQPRPSSLGLHPDPPTSSDSAMFSGITPTSQNFQQRLAKPLSLDSPSSRTARESAEIHFLQLLSRYNKLKNSSHDLSLVKDLESLMQRLLQLSERYSNQSSVISTTRDLRRMFQLDHDTNRLTRELGQTHIGEIHHKDTDVNCSTGQKPFCVQSNSSFAKSAILTPDSGLSTPPSVSASANNYYKQTSTSKSRMVMPKGFSVDEMRSENLHRNGLLSDSGLCVTDSCDRGADDIGATSRASVVNKLAALLSPLSPLVGSSGQLCTFTHLHGRSTDTDRGIASGGSDLHYLPENQISSHSRSLKKATKNCCDVSKTHSEDEEEDEEGSEKESEDDQRRIKSGEVSNSNRTARSETIELSEDIRQLRHTIAKLSSLSSMNSLSSVKPERNATNYLSTTDKSSTAFSQKNKSRLRRTTTPTQKKQSDALLTTSCISSNRHLGGNSHLLASSSSSGESKRIPLHTRPVRPIRATGEPLSPDSDTMMEVVGTCLRPTYAKEYHSLGNRRPILRTYFNDNSVNPVRREVNVASNTSNEHQRSIRPIKRKLNNRLKQKEDDRSNDTRNTESNPNWGGSMPSLVKQECEFDCLPKVVSSRRMRNSNCKMRSQSSTGIHRRKNRGPVACSSHDCNAWACNSCGGSGLQLNNVDREVGVSLPVDNQCGHSHTKSDSQVLPLRVIYEYIQPSIATMPSSVRLPVRQYSGWSERVYGMQEYGSVSLPQNEVVFSSNCPRQESRVELRRRNRQRDSVERASCIGYLRNDPCLTNNQQFYSSVISGPEFDPNQSSHSCSSSSEDEDQRTLYPQPIMPTPINGRAKTHNGKNNRRCLERDTLMAAKSVTEMAQRLQTKLASATGNSVLPNSSSKSRRKFYYDQ